jgi:hypothetical protein
VLTISGNNITYEAAGPLGGGGNPLTIIPDSPGEATWNGDMVRNLDIVRNTIVLNPVVTEQVAAATGNFGKGFIELKIGENILVEGNRFEGPSLGFTLTARNQSSSGYFGSDVWATLRNVTFRHNIKVETNTFHNSHLAGIQLEDNLVTSTPGGDILFENNLFLGNVNAITQIGASPDVTFRHNTFADTGSQMTRWRAIFAYGETPSDNFTLQDNIFYNGEYGIVPATLPLAQQLPNSSYTKNIVIDDRSPEQVNGEGSLTPKWGATNFFPTSVEYVDPASLNYRLSPSSPYKGQGTGGADPGVDMDALEAAQSGTPEPPPEVVVVCKWSRSPSCQ